MDTEINTVINSNFNEKTSVDNKIIRKVPPISLSDGQKLKLLQYIERGRHLPIAFRC